MKPINEIILDFEESANFVSEDSIENQEYSLITTYQESPCSTSSKTPSGFGLEW